MISPVNNSSAVPLQSMQGRYSIPEKNIMEIASSNNGVQGQYKSTSSINGEYTSIIPANSPSSTVSPSSIPHEQVSTNGLDRFTFSEEAKKKQSLEQQSLDSSQTEKKTGSEQVLTESEQKEVDDLKLRDKEVRAHEAAHKAAAGSLSMGAASFEYQTGPDNKRYAVGGEVSIDVSKVADNPQATIEKAQQISRAANAPADPSSQDRQVAAKAGQMEAAARKELTEASSSNSSQDKMSPTRNFTGYYQQVQSLEASSSLSGVDLYI